MSNLIPHPAIVQLLRFQSIARCQRTLSRFRGTRRLVLSALAVILSAVWFGQVVASALLREPASPDKMATWIPLGLVAYAIWHLLRTACRTPIEPFEWTAAEQELLGGAPLRRYDLVMYRLLAITVAAVAKAGCFALVMWPDLPVWLAGFLGMVMALLFIDLLRMAMEIVVYGMSKREFLVYRIGILTLAALGAATALAYVLPIPSADLAGGRPAALVIGLRFVRGIMELQHTAIGDVATRPFVLFASVILTSSITMTWLGLLTAVASIVSVMATLVMWLDGRVLQRRRLAEQLRFQQWIEDSPSQYSSQTQVDRQRVHIPFRLSGIGVLAWRQLLGAYHYRTSLGIAMIGPAALSLLTLLTPHRGAMMIVHLVGSLVFYSFLLLPTAFKFDFRRDIDRLAVLKALPISPASTTIGQLAVPVLLGTAFQLVVLLIAMAARPFDLRLLVVAFLLLVPVNVLIFALENLIFLLYPYRLNQEGLGVFFRSILTFTGKGLLFAGGVVMALLWAFLARAITGRLPEPTQQQLGTWIFLSGLCVLLIVSALLATMLLARVYRQFDPSEDTPAA